MLNVNVLNKMSASLRVLSADIVQKANSGHPGMPLGMSDVVAVLYRYFLRFNPQDPLWINRDRFILSAGHGSALLYSLLHLTGYKRFSLDQLKCFRQLHSHTAGHPEISQDNGIEVTTGPLGHGLSMSVGLAIASKKTSTLFPELINNKIYVIAGDGCLMEGVSYEAIALAGTLNLNNLIIIWDNNNITIDGEVSICSRENQKKRFEANGFLVIEIDGHSYQEIYDAFVKAQTSDRPVLISANTKIAKFAPTKEGKNSSHGSPLGEEEIKGLKKTLDFQFESFFIPEDIKVLWQEAVLRNKAFYKEWQEKYSNTNNKEDIDKFFHKEINSEKLKNDLMNLSKNIIETKPSKATRISSLDVLEVLVKDMPNLIGGSADLSSSVMTKTKSSIILNANNYTGNYINYGIREHAMGAIMNGLAASGSFIPYGGTFLVFSDFLRPALRLAALQELQSIFVLTHDSIGLGEDGPTHQPIEHLSCLRLIPNLDVIRPCDTIETIEAWKVALDNKSKPTALIFSRQNLPTLRTNFDYNNNLTAKGGYVLAYNINNNLVICDNNSSNENIISIDINLIASGSEVSLATEVSILLGEKGISSKVISMPSLNKFKENEDFYIKKVVGKPKLNVIIEAALINGYSSILSDSNTLNFGINTFGKSGKACDLYNYFGLTKENIVNKILLRLHNS